MDILSKEFYKNTFNISTDWLSQHGTNIIVIFVAGFIFYHLGGYLMKFFTKIIISGANRSNWSKRDIKKRQETVYSLIFAVWKIAISVFVITSITREIAPNLNFGTFVASLGAISVMISLGAQSLIKDFLNGLFIVSENQYRVGDIINIDGNEGTVRYIGTRTTTLRDFDGNVHYFPNGTITHVINKTMSYSMSSFKITLTPDADLDKAINLINKIGEKLSTEEKWKEKIIEAPHFQRISSIEGSGTEILIKGKTQPSEQWSVSSKMRQLLVKEFEKHGISLA